MTRDEILAMPAGRELDQLIDERFFGREFTTFPMGNCYHDGRRWVRSHNYSTDISDAWEVVEKLGDLFAVRKTPKGYIGHVITDKNEEAITCNSAPEAICKVALLVILEVKPDESN